MASTVLFIAVFALQLAFMAVAGDGFAQLDPAKVLIGRWDGQVETAKNQERTLIINSVQSSGEGEWVGRGRFGSTSHVNTSTEGGGTEMNISSKDSVIHIEFIGGQGKAPVRLKLVGDNKLEGTVNTFERGRAGDRRAVFEKVKAGDTK